MKKLSLLLCVLILMGTMCLPALAENDYEMLQNGDFEQFSSDWEKYYMATVDYSDQAHSGNGAFKITHRQHSTDIARQYITKPLEYYGPGTYEFSAWIRLANPEDQPIEKLQIAIGIYCKDGTKHWQTSDWFAVTSEWTYISGIRQLSWEGELEAAEFYLVTETNGEEDSTQNYRDLLLDDCSMKPTFFTGEPYAPETTEAPTTEPPTEPPTTEAPTTEPALTEPPEEVTPEQVTTTPEQTPSDPEPGISTQTWVIAGTMIGVGVILLAAAVALTVSYVRGKKNEASQ